MLDVKVTFDLKYIFIHVPEMMIEKEAKYFRFIMIFITQKKYLYDGHLMLCAI